MTSDEHKPHLTAGAYLQLPHGLFRDTVCKCEFPDTPEGLASANAKFDELMTKHKHDDRRYLIEVERWEPVGADGFRGTPLRSAYANSTTKTDR